MTKDIDIKKEYEKLEKKYKLPSFDKFDNEFELSNMSNLASSKFLLRIIRRRAIDRVNSFIRFYDSIIYPNPNSMMANYESKCLDEEQKYEIIKLLKILMILERKSVILETIPNEQEEAKLINDIYTTWNEVKKKFIGFNIMLKEAWEKKEEAEKNDYLG